MSFGDAISGKLRHPFEPASHSSMEQFGNPNPNLSARIIRIQNHFPVKKAFPDLAKSKSPLPRRTAWGRSTAKEIPWSSPNKIGSVFPSSSNSALNHHVLVWVKSYSRRKKMVGWHSAGVNHPPTCIKTGPTRVDTKMLNHDQPALLEVPRKRRAANAAFNPKEFKILALRECPTPAEMQLCDTPDKAAAYWRQHVITHPYYNPDVECFVVLLVNTRRKIQGHYLISTGTLDTILVHAREVFRPAVIGAASAIVLMHNHPSGDPTPSEADIKVTRDLIRGGQLLKIEVLDHIVIGQADAACPKGYTSLRELGYFYT